MLSVSQVVQMELQARQEKWDITLMFPDAGWIDNQ
jgi:hypothetical protein